MNIVREKCLNIVVKRCQSKWGVKLSGNYNEGKKEWEDWEGGWHLFDDKDKALFWADKFKNMYDGITNLSKIVEN